MKLASAMLKTTWMMTNTNILSAMGGSAIIQGVSYAMCSIKKSAQRGFI